MGATHDDLARSNHCNVLSVYLTNTRKCMNSLREHSLYAHCSSLAIDAVQRMTSAGRVEITAARAFETFCFSRFRPVVVREFLCASAATLMPLRCFSAWASAFLFYAICMSYEW